MDATDSQDEAIKFLGSMRGQYIMGQALQIAIESLESVEPEVRREYSNIQDMKFIRDELFPMGFAIAEATKKAEIFNLRDVAEETGE
jgi:hypothetical protein